MGHPVYVINPPRRTVYTGNQFSSNFEHEEMVYHLFVTTTSRESRLPHNLILKSNALVPLLKVAQDMKL